MNSDQGSHFTSPRYTGLFKEAGSKISMDHRGRAYDNIFIVHHIIEFTHMYLLCKQVFLFHDNIRNCCLQVDFEKVGIFFEAELLLLHRGKRRVLQ